jgi:Ca-activated chloride channel family protein
LSPTISRAAAIRRPPAATASRVEVAPAQSGEGSASAPTVVRVSVDGSDIQAIERRIETRFQARRAMRSARNGATKATGCCFPSRCSAALVPARHDGGLGWRCCSSPAGACLQARRSFARFADLWLMPDQQGRWRLTAADYAAAAKLFADPMWRGLAAYRALDFLAAAQEFEHVETIQGRFALGNAQAQNHAYEKRSRLTTRC